MMIDFKRMIQQGLLAIGLVLIVRALVTDGANSAGAAAAFGGELCLVAAAMVLAVGPRTFFAALRRDRWPVLGLAGLYLFVGLTLVPLPAGWAHPVYHQLGLTRGTLSIAPYRAVEGLAALTAPVCAYVLGVLSASDRGGKDRAGLVLLIGFGVTLILAIAGYFASLGGEAPRLEAGLGANGACTMAGILAVSGLASVLRHMDRTTGGGAVARSRMSPLVRLFTASPLGLAILCLSLAAALLTQSRGGLAATMAGLVTLTVLYGSTGARRTLTVRRGAPLWIWAGLGLVIYGLLSALQITVARLSSSTGEDFATRLAIVKLHWGAFLDRPVTGHGLNSFGEINAHYATPASWAAVQSVGAAHNIYVQWLEETGLVGAWLMGLILWSPLSRAVRQLGQSSSSRAWSAGALAVIVVCGVHGLTDFGLEIPAVATLLALTLGVFSQGVDDPDRRA
jgi:O-antigen ligase